jgi:hypothetical protein
MTSKFVAVFRWLVEELCKPHGAAPHCTNGAIRPLR